MKQYSGSFFILLALFIFSHQNTSAQYDHGNRLEAGYDYSGIGHSVHLLYQHSLKRFLISGGMRVHLNKHSPAVGGPPYEYTMRPNNFRQNFGPVLSIDYLIPAENWFAKPFLGYHAQLGFMGRRYVGRNDISAGTWTSYEVESPLYNWQNHLVVGSYFPFTKSIDLKIYGGLGMGALFNIDPRLNPFKRTEQEYGYQLGISLSYRLPKR